MNRKCFFIYMKTRIKYLFPLTVIAFLFFQNLNAKTIMGIVVDKATNKPIPDALVMILDKEKIYVTAMVDSTGIFAFQNVDITEFDIWTKRMGYAQIRTGPFQFEKAEVLNIIIRMEASEIVMEEIVIDEKAYDEYLEKVGFETRKHGTGKYLSYKDIMSKPHATALAVIKNIPNIIVKEGLGGTVLFSGRYAWRANLQPENAKGEVELTKNDGLCLLIDGEYEPDYNLINLLNPLEIAGIEFYASSRLVPMEYENRMRGKEGALFIWTKKK